MDSVISAGQSLRNCLKWYKFLLVLQTISSPKNFSLTQKPYSTLHYLTSSTSVVTSSLSETVLLYALFGVANIFRSIYYALCNFRLGSADLKYAPHGNFKTISLRLWHFWSSYSTCDLRCCSDIYLCVIGLPSSVSIILKKKTSFPVKSPDVLLKCPQDAAYVPNYSNILHVGINKFPTNINTYVTYYMRHAYIFLLVLTV